MNAAHKPEEWHALMLCVGVVPALVCFIILGTNGGLGAPCDTAVAPYLLVQALLTARPANRSDAEMRVLLFAMQGIASLTNVVFFCCCLPIGIALRMGGMRVIAITVQSLSLLFWFGWAIFGSMQVWGTHPYTSLSYRWTATAELSAAEAPRSGCEPGLYWGARQWLIFTYAMGGLALLCFGGISVWATCIALHKERAMKATLRVASESLGDAEQGAEAGKPPDESTTPLLKA